MPDGDCAGEEEEECPLSLAFKNAAAAAAAAVVVGLTLDFDPTLTHLHSLVLGHKTGSYSSGVEEDLRNETGST